MTRILHAVFDGSVLLPEEPLRLEPNTRVKITIETEGAVGPPLASPAYRERELSWIEAHAQELSQHRGRWVVLEGETMVAS